VGLAGANCGEYGLSAMEQILFATALFALAFAGMAIGVIVTGKKELKGSCGGIAANPDCCMTCPDKPQCDEAEALKDEFAHVAGKGGGSHPALAQAASAPSTSGPPVATPRG
jgi:hypothetical protein